MTFASSTDAGALLSAHDITITLAVSPRQKVWAAKVAIINGHASRTAGYIANGFTVHSALAIAAISALRSLSRGKLKRIDTTERRPTTGLITEDASAAQAIRAFSFGERVANFRASRPLREELKRFASRYEIQIQVVPDTDIRVQSLKGYAVNSLARQRDVFTPALVSERY